MLTMNSKTMVPAYNLFKRNLFITTTVKIKTKVNNIDINYETSGSKGKVALFLPGSMGSIRTDFAPQLKAFRKSNTEAVFWDPPGYGQSRPPNRDFSGNIYLKDAEMAAALMKKLEYDTFSLVGWSDGGITALQMALMYPERIEKLVVWGANAYFDENDVKIFEKLRDIRRWSERMRKPMEEFYGPDYFKKMWEQWTDAMIRFYNENDGQILTKDVSDISCPTLIIHGLKDSMMGEYHARFLHEKISNSRYVIWDDAKHNLHLKYAEKFNDLVTNFLHE